MHRENLRKFTETSRACRAQYIDFLAAKCIVGTAVCTHSCTSRSTSTKFSSTKLSSTKLVLNLVEGYYKINFTECTCLLAGPRGVMVSIAASCARGRRIDPHIILLSFQRKVRPQPSKKVLYNLYFCWFRVDALQFCIILPYNSFHEVMVPVPQYDLEICSGSTCNTRLTQAK
jgi:hypothetical protein